jgi:endo-beta-N-acetylglucosaminidase D
VLIVVVVVVAVVLESYYTSKDKSTKDTYPELDKLVAAIRDKAGVPAAPGVRVSRADIGSPATQRIQLDVGGEGLVDVGGLVVGFSGAINVNGVAKSTDTRPPKVTAPGRLKGQAIPHLVELPAWDTNPGLPFSDGFADAISMIDMDLTNRNVEEIARVIRDGGTIDLWLQEKYLPAIKDLASRVGSAVEEPGEIPAFKGNGKADDRTWFRRRTIVAHKAGAGNQPYAAVWYPDGLLAWDPGKDPNAIFNRSTVPLAERAWNADLRANAGARAGQGDIMALASFAPTAGNPSQGAVDSAGYYAFGYWQYIGALVFWGGSAGEGIILAPNPTVIDAAHRNGVPVFGNVFFPPADYGGKLDWVQQFVRPGIPEKLVQAAQYFGFDGWFVNQETRGGNATLAEEMRDTIARARRLAPNLRFIWYDAMASNGQVGWQGALNANNAMFFQSSGTRVSDSMFIDFRWVGIPNSLASSASYAAQLGRSAFDLYAGVDVEPTGYNNGDLARVFPASGSRTVSAGIHRTDWTYSSSSSTADFYARESAFWVGPAGDPSKATTAATWRAPATIVAERTPITAKPFVTSFNTGQGKLYAVDGVKLSSLAWNNLGLQDVLPIYRWMVSGPAGTSLVPKLDLNDAYNGGTSLLLSGSVPGAVLVRLYQTRLPVTSPTQVLVTFRAAASGPTYLQVAATFAGSTDPAYYDVGTAASADWQTVPVSLGSRTGQTLVRLDLRIAPPSPVSAYQIRIGQLAVTDGPLVPPAPPPVTLLGAARISPTRQTLRLSWTGGPPGPVHHYNVYRRNPGNDRTYLGGTSNVAYFVPRLDRVGSETATTIDVEAVSPTFARSAPASVTVPW